MNEKLSKADYIEACKTLMRLRGFVFEIKEAQYESPVEDVKLEKYLPSATQISEYLLHAVTALRRDFERFYPGEWPPN